jgi:hypothetical protein
MIGPHVTDRERIDDGDPPTAIVMNCPGLNFVAIAGATTVIATKASTRRTVSTVPRTCTAVTPSSVCLASSDP